MKNRNLNHKDDWKTPEYFYSELNDEFNFDFDPCPYMHNIEKWDGLEIEWGSRNFINPPYSRQLKEAFVKKAIEESKKGKLCVMLLPVSTSTVLFHDIILPNADDIRFIRKRIKFSGVNTKGEYVKNKPGMHDSMVVIFDGRDKIPTETEEEKQLMKILSLLSKNKLNQMILHLFQNLNVKKDENDTDYETIIKNVKVTVKNLLFNLATYYLKK